MYKYGVYGRPFVLLGYWCINPSNLIYWQQDVVSQHFLFPWFWILASWGSPSSSLHLISTSNLSCSCLWFLLCPANLLKSPPSACYLWSAFHSVLSWWAEQMILLEPLFLQSENPFCDTFLQQFSICLYICSPALLLLQPPSWIICTASVSVLWVSPIQVKSLPCCWFLWVLTVVRT